MLMKFKTRNFKIVFLLHSPHSTSALKNDVTEQDYANANVCRKYCAVLKTKNYIFITQTIRLPKNFLAQKINKFM